MLLVGTRIPVRHSGETALVQRFTTRCVLGFRTTATLSMLLMPVGCHSPTPTAAGETPLTMIVPLRGLSANRLIRWPSIASVSDTVYVAANLFPIAGDSLDLHPAYLGRLRQEPNGGLVPLEPMGLPRGDFQFDYPRVIEVRGILHLIWGEFGLRPRTTGAWPAAIQSSIWHAILHGGSWSTPERLATSQWFVWNDQNGGVAVDAKGDLHIAVWAGDSTPRVRHMRLHGSRWSTSTLPYPTLNPATGITTHGDTVAVGFVDVTADTQRVTIVESVDDGIHWINPLVVSRRAGGIVTSIRFFMTHDGEAVAIAEKPYNSFYLDTVRWLRRTQLHGGLTQQIVAIPPLSAGLQMATTPCGSAWMLIHTFSLTPKVFVVTIPRDLSSTAMQPLLSDSGTTAFAALAAGPRSLVAVFAYTARRGTPAQSVAMSLRNCSP
jgi:hypothetical protein